MVADVPGMTDADQFEAFVRKFQDMVFATAVRLLGNPVEAEDVAQTVFLRAFQRFDAIGTSPAAAGWLKTVTKNVCLNHLSRYRARWRFATSNSGRMFSASFFVRNPFPGTCAPTTPGSASARSNSAAAADISTSGSAAKALKRPWYFWQSPDSASLTILHSGSETSTGCDSIQQ